MLNTAARGEPGGRPCRQYTGARTARRRTGFGWWLAALLASAPIAGLAEPAGTHTFGVGAGVLRVNIPPVATAGVVVQPAGALRANLATDQQQDLLGGGLDYRYTRRQGLPAWLDRRQRTAQLAYRFAWGRFSRSQTTTAAVPAGTADVGLVQTKFFPPPAPPGFFPGAAGLASRARIEVDSGRLEVGVAWLQQADWLPASTTLQPGLRFGWNQFDYVVFSDDEFLDPSLPPADFADARDQALQHDVFDLTLNARLEHALGAAERFSLFADIGASLYFLKATLVSYEFVTLNGVRRRRFTGGGEREFSVGGELTVGASWRLGRRWLAEVALQHRPWVPVGTINNPVATGAAARDTFLGTAAEAQTAGLLTLRYQFGDR
ncbi:MAG: hypothetical protein V2J12_01060 [Gammaproteobacteria bacterium]|jgi:hypothetical protein|nr:hypothetical protein [Gammaproteobacteria bacterium]